MPSRRDSERSRRSVLAALSGGVVGLAGCQGLPDGDGGVTGEPTASATDPSGRSATTPDDTGTDSTTTTSTTQDRSTTRNRSTTERPLTPACPDCELVETESYVADGDGVDYALPARADDDSAAIAVLDGQWRETVDQTELTPAARTFLTDTDYAAQTVVAVQYTEPGQPQTQRLTRYERDGDELRLALTAPEMGALNAEKDELALLRTEIGRENRPTAATATVRIGEHFEVTVSTDASPAANQS